MQVRKLKRVQQHKMGQYVPNAYWTRYIDRALNTPLLIELRDPLETLGLPEFDSEWIPLETMGLPEFDSKGFFSPRARHPEAFWQGFNETASKRAEYQTVDQLLKSM